MRHQRHYYLFATVTLILSSCAYGTEEELTQRIQRIENGMLPAVTVAGEEPRGVSIQDLMERFGVPGVSVAVINNGVLEWAKGYGVLAGGGPEVDTETLFLAGHMGHAVATMGALTLVQEGRLDLDEDVNLRLTSWQIPDNEFTVSEKVTLRRILTHTSGLSVSSLLGYLPGDPVPSTAEILDGGPPATNEPIRVLAEPGSSQRYSVGGYVVLQRLLEDVTGLPYADFVQSSVLQPLGMDHSFHLQPLPEDLAANAATGHEPTGEAVQGRWRLYPELAALGMWTTPTELARLVVELQRANAGGSATVLPQASVQEMLAQYTEDRGLGVNAGGEGDWRFFRLEGHGNNFLSEFFGYVSQGTGAVVMTNSSNGEAVKAQILRAIAVEYGWPDLLPEKVEVVTLPPESLEGLVGTYSFRGRDRFVRVEAGRPLQHSEGSPDQVLLTVSEDTLVSETFGYRYAVERDEGGSVTGLTLVLDGTRLFTYERTG